ncbi:mucin-2 [Streptomyces phaeochromogenes]|uniref:mucin-2 n=1 Tax=Streptomyces phaeochromogenes TaxID=1923 RepID=UPI003688ED61
MSWFKVDDTAHAHPKLRGAGTAAIGLWTLGGSYAAQYLTDGMVHAHFIKTTATGPQLARLVKSGLWHPAGHDCPRCPQPAAGDYVIHDYLIYNPRRTKVLAERERAAEKKRKQRAGGAEYDAPEVNRAGNEDDSSSNRGRLHDASEGKKPSDGGYNSPPDSEASPGQGDVSPGDSLGTRARAVTRPDPSVLPTEEQTEETASYAREPARIGDRPRIPANSQPLVDALTTAGLVVGWDLKPAEWFVIEALINRCGIDALVASATASWQGARTRPRAGRYFLPGWRSLPDVPAGTPDGPGIDRLPAQHGGEVVALGKSRQQQETDDWADRAMARARARMQHKESS